MTTLRDIQEQWNALVADAQREGIDVQPWVRLPPTRDRGLQRLNWLRGRLGLPSLGVTADVGAALPLSEIQTQWNALVPQAQARGLRVNAWATLPPTARRGMVRLNWLRQQLGQQVSTAAVTVAIDGMAAFAGLSFGVEIECLVPVGLRGYNIAAAITEAGIECNTEVYNHTTRRTWKIVTDGSLGNISRGIELVSPPLTGVDGFRQIRKVCDVLVAKRCKISSKCGLHIHIGAASETISTLRNVAKLYKYFQNAINSFLSPSRHDNTYCRRIRHSSRLDGADTMTDLLVALDHSAFEARSVNRYRVVNFQSFLQHRTIEFRQHQGTIEADRVENWLRFCLRMMVAARSLPADAFQGDSLDRLFNVLKMTDDERTYFSGRAIHFRNRAERAARRAA